MRLLWLLGLVATGLMAGGCATAGLALAGPLAGTLTAIVDRSVERTIPADLGTAWGATADAMARMGVRLDQTEKSGAKWRLTGTGEAATVHGTLERVTAGMTKVSVRVEVGGLFADRQTGDELLNQIGVSLARSASVGRGDGTAPNADASSDQLRLLQREIQRLGTRIERAREALPATTRPESSPVATVSPTPIIVVPTSVGVATVPAPDIPLARQAAPSAFRRPPVPSDLGPDAPPDNILAAPMKSAETLRPVEALRIRPLGQ